MDNQNQPNIPPVQPLPQTPITPSINWSKIILFIFFGLIVVAGAVFAGIQIGNKKTPNQQSITKQPKIIPTQVVDNQSTNWKTYTDTKYEYQINYPDDWQKNELALIVGSQNGKEIDDNVVELSSKSIYRVIIDSENNEISMPLDKSINDLIIKNSNIFLDKNQSTKVAGLPTIAVDSQNEGNNIVTYYFIYNNKAYSISTYTSGQENYTFGEPAKIYNQILSTFKFTDSISSIPTDWKTFTFKSNEFSFQYPPIWYPDENPNYPGGNNISFFLNGTKADHGSGDHIGNEVFSFEISDDKRTLQELKNNYYPTATVSTIAGKDVIITSFNLYIIKISSSKNLTIVGGIKAADLYRDQILSTLKFTN